MWSWPEERNNVRINYAVVSACVTIVETRTKIEEPFNQQVCLLRESRVSSDFIYTVYPVLDIDDFDFFVCWPNMDASLLRSEYFISVATGLAVYVMTVITLYPGLLNTSQQQLPSATRTVREGSSILLRETWTNMFQHGYNPPKKIPRPRSVGRQRPKERIFELLA